MSQQKTYSVEGMTCEHCKLSVTEELLEVPGIQFVDVDLPTGRVVVEGEEVTDEAVASAVAAAGYRLTS